MKYFMQTAVKVKDVAKRFVYEEDGVGVVEIVLILVILVALVVIFQDQISDVVEQALDSFSSDASDIID